MRFTLKTSFFSFLFLCLYFFTASGQGSAQMQSMLEQAKASGYSEAELMNYAQQYGIDVSQLGLQQQSAPSGRVSSGTAAPGERTRTFAGADEIDTTASAVVEEPLTYFGYSIFDRDVSRNFGAANLNVATPENYILGPGDELFIDIYGASEQYYEARITPDGDILLGNFGPIPLAGLTINEAKNRIRSRLSRIYTGMSGNNPNTFLQVTLGSIRSITVNLVGELNVPGSYTLNSLSTVFNALYAAGGPNTNGSLREIGVYRNNERVATLDVYQFLINGKSENNIMLQDNDLILVKPYLARVQLIGEVKRPAVFEIKPDETFEDLLMYAGGFTDDAYTARVNVTRNTDKEKVVSDIFEGQYSMFNLKGGDVITVGKIMDRFQNRVQIKGAVFRPGNYALTSGLSVSDLIARADGLRGDAFRNRALLTRTQEDLSTSTLSVDLAGILEGTAEDIVLQREDVLLVQSIYELNEERYVKISGEVNRPGSYPFSESMSVEDLIFIADGFKRSAEAGVIEISRRSPNQSADNQTEVFTLSIDENLSLDEQESAFIIKPFDHIMVRRNPDFYEEKIVQVTGEVKYPGSYAILKEGERISEVIRRSGGLKDLAYAEGATLIRRTEFFDLENEESRQSDLRAILSTMDTLNISEADARLRLALLNEINATSVGTNENISTRAKKQRLEEIVNRSAYLTEINIASSEPIPLDLDAIMQKPGSGDDLILEEGDIISVPKQLQTVRLRGRVLYPNTVRYKEGRGLKYYINQAGGFDNRAKKHKTYVVYANGEVDKTDQFLFFHFYPRVEPGAEIIVPTKPLKIPLAPNQIVGIGTGLAGFALLITQIVNQL